MAFLLAMGAIVVIYGLVIVAMFALSGLPPSERQRAIDCDLGRKCD